MRPFECQTASRGIPDVSVPHALSSYEFVWIGGRTGRLVLTFLHILATCIVVVSDLNRTPYPL